ncbi:MAG: 50S ribosomal protein L15 [Phycisphaerae bacterium]|jgi:large subunit ribosomal protein L15
MMIDEITKLAGAHKRRKRVGRGESSGHGKTCGRGDKGMQSRAGNGPHPLFEGGATPLYRKSPKRGFSNAGFRRRYQPVNLEDLETKFAAGERVDRDALHRHGLIGDPRELVKLLGKELSHKLAFEVHAASASARAAIEKAGGSLSLIALRDAAALAKAKRKTAQSAKRDAGPGRLVKKRAARGG